MDRLVAFLVLEAGVALDRATIRADLRDELPPYMIPSHFEIVEALPRLSSGKVDRKVAARWPSSPSATRPASRRSRANETEAALLVAAKRVFGNQAIPFDADFFTDLGGHSLLAARFVSACAKSPVLASITLQDVYGKRSLRAMADDLIEQTGGAGAAHVARDLSFDAAAADAPLPLRPRAGRGAAGHPRRSTRRSGSASSSPTCCSPAKGSASSARWRRCSRVYVVINVGDGADRDRAQMGGDRADEARPLPALGRLLLPLVVRAAARAAGAHQVAAGLADDAASTCALMGAQVGGDAIIADIDAGAIDLVSIGRGATHRLEDQDRERRGHRQRDGHRRGRHRRRRLCRLLLRDRPRRRRSASMPSSPTSPRSRTARVIGEAEKWDGSPGVKVGMVDVAALPDFAEATPARRAAFDLCLCDRLAAICRRSACCRSSRPSTSSTSSTMQISEFLEVSYLWYLPVLAWPTALFMIFATVGAHRADALARAAARSAAGTYSIVQRLLHAQMGGGAGDRGDARDADLALRHDLHAGLVPRSWARRSARAPRSRRTSPGATT